MRPLPEWRRREREHGDKRPIRVYCAWCHWTKAGTLAECREAARAHREKQHPESLRRKRQPKSGHNLGAWIHAPLSKREKTQVLKERDRRAKLHGVELDA